jgi:uncharacterized protein (TIGR00299 family) protein
MKKKILYFEAPDGISGDMTLGALIDLGVDPEAIKRELDLFVPEEYVLVSNAFERNGIHGISLDVIVAGEHGHAHRDYSEIRDMIADSGISDRAKAYALEIFRVIAEAEASVHRVGLEKVAFHEVGAMDSIIDIVGVAIAVDLLDVMDFYTAAPRDGSGTIVCRHGLIPVPVPAVLEMAKGADIPIVIENDVHTEMITPTGFGIIKGLRAKFEPHLGIIPEKTGYGFGKRDTGRLGAVRVTLGVKYEEETTRRSEA